MNPSVLPMAGSPPPNDKLDFAASRFARSAVAKSPSNFRSNCPMLQEVRTAIQSPRKLNALVEDPEVGCRGLVSQKLLQWSAAATATHAHTSRMFKDCFLMAAWETTTSSASKVMKIAKRYLQKGETIYETKTYAGGGHQAGQPNNKP